MKNDNPPKKPTGLFKDLTDPRLMYLKAALFLVAGLLCAGAIFAQNPGFLTLFLLVLMVWSFCRLYYFFFYVIEKYIDSGYKFDSMHSAIIFLITRKSSSSSHSTPIDTSSDGTE